MKPLGFLAGLAVGLLGLAAFVVTSRSAAPTATPIDQLHELAWLRRELKLDDAQARKVAALEATYASAVTDCCANHCAARMDLGAAVFAAGRDPEKLEAMVAAMGKAQLESDLATVRHIQAVHALLTPEQQKTYEQLVTSCVCADCPSCSKHAPQGDRTNELEARPDRGRSEVHGNACPASP